MSKEGDAARIASTLEGLVRCARRVRAVNDVRPRPGSKYLTEATDLTDQTGCWADRPVAFAVRAGIAHLAFAESHLRAMAPNFREVALDDPPVRAAARQIMEGSGYAFWLLDTAVDARARAERGLQEATYALKRRSESIHKDLLNAGHDMGEWPGGDKLSAIDEVTTRLGLTLEARPNAATVFEMVLPNVRGRPPGAMPKIVQRVLSGGVHPDLSPLLETDLFSPQGFDTWDAPPAPDLFLFNVALAVSSYERAMSELITGCGWDPSPWTNFAHPRLNELYDLTDSPTWDSAPG